MFDLLRHHGLRKRLVMSNEERLMKAAQPLKSYSALLFALALACIGPGLADAAMISINPSKDNTLYQYNPNEGDLSNALGFHFFTGTILMGESFFFFSSRRRHTRLTCDWSSDVCSSD